LKGRTGSGSKLWLQTDSGFSKEVSLAGMDLSRWTFVHVGGYYAGFTGSVVTTLKVDLTPATGVADDCDVEVGPTVACFRAGGVGDSYPQWLNNTRTKGDSLSVASFVLPRTGSAVFSLYVPQEFAFDSNNPALVALMANSAVNNFQAYVSCAVGSANATLIFYFGSGGGDVYSAALPAATFFTPGSVQTIAITWGQASLSAYLNGALLSTRAGAIETPVAATTLYLFSLAGYYSTSSLVALHSRIERAVLSADEIADLHATYSNKASAGLIAAARGRVYQIEEIPSIPRTCDTGTNWVGNLRLRQVEYVPSLADITTKEG
jgi:hypothetical protein